MVHLGSVIVLSQAEYGELVDAGKFVAGVQVGEVLIWNDLLWAAMAADAYLHSRPAPLEPAGQAVCDALVVAIGAALRVNGSAGRKDGAL